MLDLSGFLFSCDSFLFGILFKSGFFLMSYLILELSGVLFNCGTFLSCITAEFSGFLFNCGIFLSGVLFNFRFLWCSV